ncbi:hypothetical protein MMC29_004078 [Sticta canariensis]|nr:hypothetical protein [Sticta canariensis]
MADVILNSSVDDLLQLTHKERLDTLITMSIEMLDSLAPTQLEYITFDWLRAYHATMYNLSYVEIKNINAMVPQIRRFTLHDIILARDDRSFDRLDPLSVQWLLAIFNDRKAKAGHAFFPTDGTFTLNNEFSVPDGFFAQNKKSWEQQANELHAGLERFDLAPDNSNSNNENSAHNNADNNDDNNTRQRRSSITATSDPGLLSSELQNLLLEDRHPRARKGTSSRGDVTRDNGWRMARSSHHRRTGSPRSRREQARSHRYRQSPAERFHSDLTPRRHRG